MSKKSVAYPFMLVFLAIVQASVPADASTANASFDVSVTVLPYCAASASPMKFGTYSGTEVTATSTVSVNCNDTILAPYNVGMSAGLAPGATVASRMLIGPGSALLGYSPRSGLRGLVSLGQAVGAYPPAVTNGVVQTLSVPGQISAGRPAGMNVDADLVSVTITY